MSTQSRSLSMFVLMVTLIVAGGTASVQGVTTNFTGGDIGEGLDFGDGAYRYAVDVNGPGGTIQGLTFSSGAQPGVTLGGGIDVSNAAGFGGSANDTALTSIMAGLRFNFAPGSTTFNYAVTPNNKYELKLLVGSVGFNTRTQDVLVNGAPVADNVLLPAGSVGTQIAHAYLADSATTSVVLGPTNLINPPGAVGGDNNAVLNAFAVKETKNLATSGQIIAGSSAYNGQPFNQPQPNVGNFAATNVIDNSVSDIFGQNYWLGTDGRSNEFFVLDLGKPVTIDEVQLRNTHNTQHNDSGTQDFRIYASNTVDGANNLINAFLLVEGTLSDTSNQSPIVPDVFNSLNGLSPSAARFLRFEALNFRAGDVRVGLNEILVFGADVPEPASVMLALLGAVGLLTRRNRLA